MPISPLPEGTVRQLGSTLVITSPVLLLKELLDNAIDAGATSIDVLVSPNTVDKIEVRDNGHGINPSDFDCLGRPGHTSKLRSFDEVSTLGGATLGFRGAALASANALADVSLTARVPTEHVATVISLAKGGGVGSQRHVGAPVGTTVSVTRLFSRLPVRLQLAIKEALKNLSKMKELLQSYALARPGLRLRFTVQKSPNLSWSYSPAANGGIKEAAMQLFGVELASQCTFQVFSSETTTGDENAHVQSTLSADQGSVFEALLPKPDADPSRVSNKGAFLSVDSRPISHTRGTGKRLVSMFRRHVGDHFAKAHSENARRDVFIRLNIRCPSGSYDVNIEPSKEDVLFKEEERILSQFECFLSLLYSVSERPQSPQPAIAPEATDTEKQNGVAHELPAHGSAPQVPATSWKVDMSSGVDVDGMSDDDEDGDGNDGQQEHISEGAGDGRLSAPEDDGDEDSRGKPSREELNPWSIAKLTSRNRTAKPRPERPELEIHHETRPQPSDIHHETRPQLPERGTPELDSNFLSLTQESLPNEALEHAHARRDKRANLASKGWRLQDVFGNASGTSSGAATRPSARQTRPRRNLGMQSPPTSSPNEQDYDRDGLRERNHRRHAARPGGFAQSQISFDGYRAQLRRNNAGMDITEQVPEVRRPTRRTRGAALTHTTGFETADLVLADRLGADTEHRRAALQPSPPRRPLPHSGCGANEGPTDARPSSLVFEEDAHQTDVRTDDPRKRLMELQRLDAQDRHKKPKRLKTEQLPLETIPRGFQTCTLLITVAVDACALAQLISEVSHFDAWLVDGKLRGAFENGTGPEDTAALIEPLLARIRSEAPVAS